MLYEVITRITSRFTPPKSVTAQFAIEGTGKIALKINGVEVLNNGGTKGKKDGFFDDAVGQIGLLSDIGNPMYITSYQLEKGKTYDLEITVITSYSIHYTKLYDRVDSAIVDVFNPEANKAISGLPLPADQPAWNFVRKTMVKKSTSLLGSVAANTYWDKVRGTSTEDSEWLPVPLTYMRPQYCVPFTSYGHHGVSNINSIRNNFV